MRPNASSRPRDKCPVLLGGSVIVCHENFFLQNECGGCGRTCRRTTDEFYARAQERTLHKSVHTRTREITRFYPFERCGFSPVYSAIPSLWRNLLIKYVDEKLWYTAPVSTSHLVVRPRSSSDALIDIAVAFLRRRTQFGANL